MKLTVVIPTYNEKDNLPKMSKALFSLPIPELHLLVVDDNSPDGTGKLAERLSEKYNGRISVLHREGKLGLGTAYVQGFQKALSEGAEAICQMDADFSHPPEKIVELLRAIRHSDVALGSRYVEGGQLDEKWPLWRKALSAFGNIYARTILHMDVKDVTGGFRIWRRETLLGMPIEQIQASGYAFQVEMAYIAHRLGYTFSETPIYFAEREEGVSKMSFKIQVEAAIRVWQLLLDYSGLRPETAQRRLKLMTQLWNV